MGKTMNQGRIGQFCTTKNCTNLELNIGILLPFLGMITMDDVVIVRPGRTLYRIGVYQRFDRKLLARSLVLTYLWRGTRTQWSEGDNGDPIDKHWTYLILLTSVSIQVRNKRRKTSRHDSKIKMSAESRSFIVFLPDRLTTFYALLW